MQEGLRQTELGQPEPILERRIEWKGPGRLRPVAYSRKVSLKLQAEFAGPEDFLEAAWTDIAASAQAAGVITGLPTLAAPTQGLVELFEEAFYTCLAARWPLEARRVRIGLSTQLRPEEEWQPSCH